MDIFCNLIACGLMVVLPLTGLIYMLSPRKAGEFFKRFALLILGLLVGMCVLKQLALVLTDRPPFVLLFLAASVAAYFVRRFRVRHIKTDSRDLWGVERTPLMPGRFDEKRQ